jgi:hypothetical protein
MAYERAVGDINLPFEVSSGAIVGLLDDLVLQDALEAAGIDREAVIDSDGKTTDLELDVDELFALIEVLNSMSTDGDEEAEQAYEAIMEQLGFTLV